MNITISITVDMLIGDELALLVGEGRRSPGNRPSITTSSVPATKIHAAVAPPGGTGCSIGASASASTSDAVPTLEPVPPRRPAAAPVAVVAEVTTVPPTFASYADLSAAGTSTVPSATRFRYSGSSSSSLPMRCCTNEVAMQATIAAGMVMSRICGSPKPVPSMSTR